MISVSSASANTYAVLGEDMDGVSGIQLALGYNCPASAFPTVTQGSLVSGALLTANTTVPGIIRIALVKPSPFFGSGRIATVSFGAVDGDVGITSITARLIDANGANLPVRTAVLAESSAAPITPVNPATPPATTAQLSPPSGAQTSAMATPSTTATVLGTVTMPGNDSQPKSESKTTETTVNPPPPETAPRAEEAAPRQHEVAEEKPAPPEKMVEPERITYPGVLDRFAKYTGGRTLSALTALFDAPVAPELRQKPAIAVSDGIMKLHLSYTLPKGINSLSSLTLAGAEFVSMEHDSEAGVLTIEVIPKNNAVRASLTITTKQTIAAYPLTVVPPVAAVSGKEQDFGTFIKGHETKKPKFDLNGDGVHDYVDDYLYTGWYLIRRTAKP